MLLPMTAAIPRSIASDIESRKSTMSPAPSSKNKQPLVVNRSGGFANISSMLSTSNGTAPSTPFTFTRPAGKNSCTSNNGTNYNVNGNTSAHKQRQSYHRLYKAPQASIRRTDTAAIVPEASGCKSGNTRRRRGRPFLLRSNSLTGEVNHSSSNHHSSQEEEEQQQQHISAVNTLAGELPEPPLWMDGNDLAAAAAMVSSTTAPVELTPPSRRNQDRHQHQWVSRSTHTATGFFDDDSSIHQPLDEESIGVGDGGGGAQMNYGDHSFSDLLSGSSTRGSVAVGAPPSSSRKRGRLSSWRRLCCRFRTARHYHHYHGSGGGCFWSTLQLLVLIILGCMIYDAHRKVGQHKVQLQQYDEERAHILEQMMWIDKAAKKVHKKYASPSQQAALLDLAVDGTAVEEEHAEASSASAGSTAQSDSSHHNIQEVKLLRNDISKLRREFEQLHVRIQMNSREFIQDKFGDKPVQVALRLDESIKAADSLGRIVIGLSEDTPHAAATFLQQIDKKMWDQIQFQKLGADTIQVSTKHHPNTTPLLEFVEKSRGCHDVGSVSARQLQTTELRTLVLRIRMKKSPSVDYDKEVCIGQIVEGLDDLRGLDLAPVVLHEAEDTSVTQ